MTLAVMSALIYHWLPLSITELQIMLSHYGPDTYAYLTDPAIKRGYFSTPVYLDHSGDSVAQEFQGRKFRFANGFTRITDGNIVFRGEYSGIKMVIGVLEANHVLSVERILKTHEDRCVEGSRFVWDAQNIKLANVFSVELRDIGKARGIQEREQLFAAYLVKCAMLTAYASTGSYAIFENEHMVAHVFGDFISEEKVLKDVRAEIEFLCCDLLVSITFIKPTAEDPSHAMNIVRQFLSGVACDCEKRLLRDTPIEQGSDPGP